jgi:Tfp pilus assembly protein PilE
MARISLLLGLFGMFSCAGLWIGSIAGLYLGENARSRLAVGNESRHVQTAKAGIALNLVALIVGSLVFILLPGFLSSRRSANEDFARTSLRAIHAAQIRHAGNHNGTFADDLTALDLDPVIREMQTKEINGYRLGKMTVTAADGIHPARFSITAQPVRPRGILRTGNESYFLNETGTVWFTKTYENNSPATAASEPVRD